MKDLAPIALFCFNRPIHLKKTLSSLKKIYFLTKVNIYIFDDGAKTEKDLIDVDKVRNLVKNFKWFKKKKSYLENKNFGLAKNIISGVNYVLKRKKIIVLEDDLIY
jgi:glycosyltransferase involved in cell wall biosynthesis